MAAQGNNYDFDVDLHHLFENEFVKLGYYNLSLIDRRHVQFHLGNAGPFPIQHGSPDIDLHLKFYIDQAATLSKEQIFTELEQNMAEFCYHLQGTFVERSVEPFREQYATTVSYRLKLLDYESFQERLHRFAQAKLNKEFTEALESKLSED